MNKRILISAPISNRAWILPHYLQRIYDIDYDKKLIDIYWIVNNSNDNSKEILQDFKQKYKNEYNSINIDIYNSPDGKFKDERSTHIRESKTYKWLSELRNKILKKCINLNCDYLFSCDSDILVQSDVLNRLLEHNKNIVASLIYNGYLVSKESIGNYSEAYKYPNILKEVFYGKREYKHICNYKTKFPEKNDVGTLIDVDFTGACVLMSKEVCQKTKYEPNKYGEDEVWSFTARQAGFNLFCDISTFQSHMMSQECLDMFLQGNLR